MAFAGEKPGKGIYRCAKCLSEIVLESDDDALPTCPNCNNTIIVPKED